MMNNALLQTVHQPMQLGPLDIAHDPDPGMQVHLLSDCQKFLIVDLVVCL